MSPATRKPLQRLRYWQGQALLSRDFRDQDNPAFTPDPKPKPDPNDKLTGPRVIIVNESFAKKFFAKRSAFVDPRRRRT